MEKTFLIAVNFAAYLLFIYKCFTLAEGMLYGKHYGLLFRLHIGVVNAALMVVMALNIPINLAYLITLVALYLELWVVFRKSIKDTLFVSVAIMMNIMCLRGIVISLFALAMRGTLYSVCSNPTLFLSALILSNMLEWLALFAILRFIRMEDLRFAMQNKTQSKYIIIWASLCVLFMFRSSEVYVRDYSIPNMFIDHLSYCFMLLLSFYFFLNYTFKLNKTAAIRQINKSLSQALGNQMALQSALMRDAIFATQANLTQNKVIVGLDVDQELLQKINGEYDAWFEFATSRIHPDDCNIYFKSLKRQNLLDNFNKGIEPKNFEYRRIDSQNNWKWIRLTIRMFRDVESDDVYAFGYGFDIENEVRDRQQLLLNAQKDLFTGLYNKATTEKIIEQEIKKGAGILILLDLDDFKGVNDGFGHEAGDYVLKYISNLLIEVFRKDDILGRVGGDEFMIYLKDTTDISIAEARASEMLTRLKTGVDYENIRIIIGASIGIFVVDEKVDSFSLAYTRVDSAMYQAKSEGKNRYVIYGNSEHCSVC